MKTAYKLSFAKEEKKKRICVAGKLCRRAYEEGAELGKQFLIKAFRYDLRRLPRVVKKEIRSFFDANDE